MSRHVCASTQEHESGGCAGMRRWTCWRDWMTFVLGVWLFLSPWVFGPTAVVVLWNAWLFGTLVTALAVWTLGQPDAETAEGVLGVLGLWLFMSPWVLGYSGVHPDDWNAWLVGALLVILPAWNDQAIGIGARAGLSGAVSDRSARRHPGPCRRRRMLPLGR